MNLYTSRANRVVTLSQTLTENKKLQSGLYAWGFSPELVFDMGYLTKQDHAGFYLEICVFGFAWVVHIFDIRSWNYDENRWMTQAESQIKDAADQLAA
jgi:hypothetical protein